MSRNKTTDPPPPDNNHNVPAAPPRDPIEPDPMNPISVRPQTEPKISERPDLDWTEHED